MKDTRRSISDIDNTKKKNEQDVSTGTGEGKGIVEDANRVNEAAKKIELKGTEEGGKEINQKVSEAMDKTKEAHKKIDEKLDNKFGEIKEEEKDLSGRAEATKKDIDKINSELRNMKSKDTADAKREMQSAVKAGEKDQTYLKDSEKEEERIRKEGEKEMKSQKQKMNSFKIAKL